jgi:hypothetical protein
MMTCLHVLEILQAGEWTSTDLVYIFIYSRLGVRKVSSLANNENGDTHISFVMICTWYIEREG